MKVLWTVCALLLFWIPASTRAQLVVTDPPALIQATIAAKTAYDQVQQMQEAFQKQLEELQVAYEQRDALLGARGLARLLNGPEEQAARRGLPGTWDRVLGAVSSDEFPEFAEELQAIYGRLREEPDLANVIEVFGGALQGTAARSYDRMQRTTLANLAISEKAYNDSSQRITDYERLIEEIDLTPDLKASNDLVARLLAENGLAMNELIRLQSIQLSASSADQAAMLATRANLAQMGRFDAARYRRVGEGGRGARYAARGGR